MLENVCYINKWKIVYSIAYNFLEKYLKYVH